MNDIPSPPDFFRPRVAPVMSQFVWRTLVGRMGWIGVASCATFFAVTAVASEVPSNETNRTQFRLGFSSATFTDVNENDAKAGLKVWAQMLLKERGLPVDPEPMVLKDSEEIVRALRSKRLDAITLNTDE
jgi:hypothetical protein